MYGDHHYGKRDSGQLGFTTSASLPTTTAVESSSSRKTQHSSIKTTSSDRMPPQANGQVPSSSPGALSPELKNGQRSPSLPFPDRPSSGTATSQFPLNNLDYESDPAAVAQELSNLQALRRMSMDVNATGDPDLPSFNSNLSIPSRAPTGSDDEDDTSRMYWVPARIHPELAPTEFKTFIDSRVASIKRRSQERSLAPDDPEHEGSGGSLRRRKSMLSRQIDNSGGKGAEGYVDGAERLDRKRSLSGGDTANAGIRNLQDLGAIVNDPDTAMQRLSTDTTSSTRSGEGDDIPILPSAPIGNSLRRSTRTNYRRGSLRKDRGPLSRRAGRTEDIDGEETTISGADAANEIAGISRVRTEPLPTTERITENFSRPVRSKRVMPLKPSSIEATKEAQQPQSAPTTPEFPKTHPPPKHFVSQIASNGRSSISPQVLARTIPHIVETPPPSDEARPKIRQGNLPERVSSHEPLPSLTAHGSLPLGTVSQRSAKWPSQMRPNQLERGNQTLKDMAAHPSPLPGNSTRTDSLSFIPTLTEDKKVDTRKTKDKKEKDGVDGPKKSSWSWGSLLGSEEKEKEKKRDEDIKKAKSKLARSPEKPHDSTRLDLLQTTMEGSRGRESLVLDRGDIKLEEERKKESSRKSSASDIKKEKDASLFSTLFGGKKKNEREPAGKKHISRNLSPDPPARILKPDVDYNWTRFSILEERAIYRMAHIKLANPRRALQSQVLLSNFMYSYLAKVQQMHPQIQMPQSVALKQQQQQQQQQRKVEQPEEFAQYQRYQEVNCHHRPQSPSLH